jgi:hypothetical protein
VIIKLKKIGRPNQFFILFHPSSSLTNIYIKKNLSGTYNPTCILLKVVDYVPHYFSKMMQLQCNGGVGGYQEIKGLNCSSNICSSCIVICLNYDLFDFCDSDDLNFLLVSRLKFKLISPKFISKPTSKLYASK